MDINTFYINALRNKAHYKRAWAFRVFGVALDGESKDAILPWTVVRDAVGVYYTDAKGNREPITDAVLGKALLTATDLILVPPKFFEFWPEGGVTTAGNLLLNATAVWPVVGAKFGYFNGTVSNKDIEQRFLTMQSDPEDLSMKDPSVVYVSDWLKYGQAIKYMEEFSPLFIWTMSRQSIVPSKVVLARKAELLTQHAAELDDPLVQARIKKELEDLDAKLLKDDPGAAFIGAGKSKLARSKLTIAYGSEQGLDMSKRPPFITQSLHDGLRPQHLVDVLNVSRAGSFDRGSETMLGGVEAKWGDRVTMGSEMAVEDCGTTLGYTYRVKPQDVANTIGRWQMLEGGLALISTSDQAMAKIGEVITVRSPNRCKSGPSSKWCKFCLGAQLSENPQAIGLAVSAYGSGFLQLFLQSMHAKATVMKRMNVRALMS